MGETETVEDRQRLERWLDDGQYMLGRVVPSLAEEREVVLEADTNGEARAHGARERIAQTFDNLLSNAFEVAPPGTTVTVSVRIDGPWAHKSRACLFRLPQEIAFAQAPALHGPWYPDAVAQHGVMYRSYYRLYHLKMIRREDRVARRDLYRRLDPERRLQPMGYDYLAEEGPALRLAAVAPGRGYALASLPKDLAALLQA